MKTKSVPMMTFCCYAALWFDQ